MCCTTSCRRTAKLPVPKTQLFAPPQLLGHSAQYHKKQAADSVGCLGRWHREQPAEHVMLLPVPKYTWALPTKGTEWPQLPVKPRRPYWEPQLPCPSERQLSGCSEFMPQQTRLRSTAREDDAQKVPVSPLLIPRCCHQVWLLACR